jgi:aminoglycoside 3-N-acetyltransferase
LRSVPDLTGDLRLLGIRAGDTVMVHASLRAIGPVDGRAAGVIEALDAAVGVDGTLLMTLGARDDWAWVNEKPEAERAALLAGAEPFDPLQTPSLPEVGTLAEVFRQLPGTRVNDHPEARFGARGKRAADLLRDGPWDDYYGPGSALERLVQAGGKVLRMSADLDTVTLLHYAEAIAPVESKKRARRHRLVVRDGVAEIRAVETWDDEEGIVDYPGEDYFAQILRAYLATGRASQGLVGNAASELIDAGDIVAFGVSWMVEHFQPGSPGTGSPAA